MSAKNVTIDIDGYPIIKGALLEATTGVEHITNVHEISITYISTEESPKVSTTRQSVQQTHDALIESLGEDEEVVGMVFMADFLEDRAVLVSRKGWRHRGSDLWIPWSSHHHVNAILEPSPRWTKVDAKQFAALNADAQIRTTRGDGWEYITAKRDLFSPYASGRQAYYAKAADLPVTVTKAQVDAVAKALHDNTPGVGLPWSQRSQSVRDAYQKTAREQLEKLA